MNAQDGPNPNKGNKKPKKMIGSKKDEKKDAKKEDEDDDDKDDDDEDDKNKKPPAGAPPAPPPAANGSRPGQPTGKNSTKTNVTIDVKATVTTTTTTTETTVVTTRRKKFVRPNRMSLPDPDHINAPKNYYEPENNDKYHYPDMKIST